VCGGCGVAQSQRIHDQRKTKRRTETRSNARKTVKAPSRKRPARHARLARPTPYSTLDLARCVRRTAEPHDEISQLTATDWSSIGPGSCRCRPKGNSPQSSRQTEKGSRLSHQVAKASACPTLRTGPTDGLTRCKRKSSWSYLTKTLRWGRMSICSVSISKGFTHDARWYRENGPAHLKRILMLQSSPIRLSGRSIRRSRSRQPAGLMNSCEGSRTCGFRTSPRQLRPEADRVLPGQYWSEWDRRSHGLMVMADGFAWNGQTYTASKVAFESQRATGGRSRFSSGLREKADRPVEETDHERMHL